MARQLIEELKKMNVQYVVAPYEADPQMVYLEQQGIVHGIISEDSDLLVFGAKRLLSKLDQHGECIEINRADFTACREVSLVGWSDADFRRMCILSGCDYLANIPKMGLKTAYRSIRKHRTVEKALRMLQFDGQFKVPADYLKDFKQAEDTFLYQRVFCPKAKKLIPLTPPEEGVNLEEMPFVGADVDPETAAGVASGDLDPTTKEPIEMKPLVAGKVPLGLSRRQTLGSSSELKPSKPINSFFTPKRKPLAELDPNSLTPSPSQQRLLERNANNSWQPNSVPLRSNTVRATPVRAFSDQGLSPMIRSVGRNTVLAQNSRAPNLQPTKRQRLCSEAEDDSLPACPSIQSRFFATTEQVSPSGQKVSRSKKARQSMMDVFSDEVAEDIFSRISDPVLKGKATLYQGDSNHENTPSRVKSEVEVDGVAIPDPKTDDEQAPTENLAPESELLSADNEFNQALGYHVQRQNSTISGFTFRSGSKPASPVQRSPMSRIPVIQTSQREAFLSSPRTPVINSRNKSPQRQRLTPLQRMGQAALHRSRSINFPTSLRHADSSESQSDEAPVTTQTNTPQGSEDFLVPDSDDSEEEISTSFGQTPTLDLKRFSFAAK
jgi:exonuclease-1